MSINNMTPHERTKFIEDVASAINIKVPALSEDEHRWVKLAIQKEAQSVKFREAVIEKTFTGVIWLLIIGLGVLVREWLGNHGLKF